MESRHHGNTLDFVASLRPVCETIFYFLILSYMSGIRAELQSPCYREDAKIRDSVLQKAYLLAEQTMELALAATTHAASGDYIKADEVATN